MTRGVLGILGPGGISRTDLFFARILFRHIPVSCLALSIYRYIGMWPDVKLTLITKC